MCVYAFHLYSLHITEGAHRHTNTHTCLIVTAGLQSFSSSNRDRQTVPDGYTFG